LDPQSVIPWESQTVDRFRRAIRNKDYIMRISAAVVVTVLSAVLLASGCAKHDSPAEKAVESAKDALDIREHEKLKDAGEEAKDAINDAVDGVKDAADGN
jgi:hypothetical protein